MISSGFICRVTPRQLINGVGAFVIAFILSLVVRQLLSFLAGLFPSLTRLIAPLTFTVFFVLWWFSYILITIAIGYLGD